MTINHVNRLEREIEHQAELLNEQDLLIKQLRAECDMFRDKVASIAMDMYRKSQVKWDELEKQHDHRVGELLAANNIEVERRRIAEKALLLFGKMAPWLVANSEAMTALVEGRGDTADFMARFMARIDEERRD